MTTLYTKLAEIYHEMYQSIFDYDAEFRAVDKILREYSARRVLEIGCGASNLANRFADAGYDYMGMDCAKPMLRIAHRDDPEAHFRQGDMRRLSVPKKFDRIYRTATGSRCESQSRLDVELGCDICHQ